MSLKRLVYRSGQFRRHLASRPAAADLAEARRVLNPLQMELFLKMQISEQAHSLDVLNRLLEEEETVPDLLAAALLHDVGKLRYPLRIWERVWIVLARKFLPRHFKIWGEISHGFDNLPWWKRACIVAVQHPAWGAELAQAAGCSSQTVALIRRHQERLSGKPGSSEERSLLKLQMVDDQS